MKPNFRTCPQCSTRNRLDKEFCVKCGEPLEGVAAGDPKEASKKGKPGFVVMGEGDQARSPIVPLLLLFVTLGIAVGAWQVLMSAPAAPVSAAQKPAPQVQASLPPVIPVPMGPGVQDYTAGMAALRAGDSASAVRHLRLAVAAGPNRADYHLGLAEALEASGVTTEALAEFERAASLDRANPRFISESAKALNRAGRYSEAIRTYEASLIIDPDNLANLRELANLYLKSSDLAKARPHLEKVVRLQPDDLTPKQSLARALEAAQDLDGAAKQYRDILTAMPSADLTRALLADLLVKQGRPDEAIGLLDEGLRLNANAALFYREKGRVYDRQGRRAEAIAAYREYVRRAPTASDVRTFTVRIDQLTALLEQS
jgi:tetratricopeptide (TPR) repeat protein